MRVCHFDAAVDAALTTARAAGLRLILRMQDTVERRLVMVDGGIDRDRTNRLAGLGVHVCTEDGFVGFASVDDVRPEAATEAVRRAGRLAIAARAIGGGRTDAFQQLSDLSATPEPGAGPMQTSGVCRTPGPADTASIVRGAQDDLAVVPAGAGRTIRTTFSAVDEEWRIVRSDGADLQFRTPHALLRHEVTSRLNGNVVRAVATVAGLEAADILEPLPLARLWRRTGRAARDALAAAGAPPPAAGSYRLVLNHALAKGLAHEAIGHLCESDVDGSVLMRHGRLRIGEQLARATVTVVDGPLPGDFAQQPVSANGILRQPVALIEHGVLAAGLGDLFSAAAAGVPITGACRASSFRDRPTPRMTNIRIQLADASTLAADPDTLTADDVAAALDGAGLLDSRIPTLYLAGYRGGQAHPRRGDFVFGADAAYDLLDGASPRGPASFTGLAERALEAIVAGIGPICADAAGMCSKDGSAVTSSGGSHALLVLDPDPDLVISAAT